MAWAIHWGLASRAVRGSDGPAERRSGIRKLLLYAVLLVGGIWLMDASADYLGDLFVLPLGTSRGWTWWTAQCVAAGMGSRARPVLGVRVRAAMTTVPSLLDRRWRDAAPLVRVRPLVRQPVCGAVRSI